MRNLLCCLICLLLGVYAAAARNLTGRVISAESGEPLAFANVTALCVADSSLMGGSVSDEKGAFAIALQDNDNRPMFLRVTYVGYNTADKPQMRRRQ